MRPIGISLSGSGTCSRAPAESHGGAPSASTEPTEAITPFRVLFVASAVIRPAIPPTRRAAGMTTFSGRAGSAFHSGTTIRATTAKAI